MPNLTRPARQQWPAWAYICQWLLWVSPLCVSLLWAPLAAAQPQLDPALRDKLRRAIANADSFEDEFAAQVWLVQKSGVLARFIDDPQRRVQLLKQIHRAAKNADIAPEFVLAVIHIESHFNRFAVSRVGAQGMMQVMPFWKREIGRESDNLMHTETNLRYGCTILKHYLDRAKGDWKEALARYNGSYGQTWYPDKVFTVWEKYWR